MKLADMLAKIAKGDALTDEEKKFIGEYDEQKTLDTAAANARKKAEKEAKDAKDALEKLQGEFDEFKSQNDPAKKQTELDKALARIAKLEQANQDKDAKIAADARTARVRSLAKEAGISPAKGVSSDTIDLLVDNLMAKVDIDDADVKPIPAVDLLDEHNQPRRCAVLDKRHDSFDIKMRPAKSSDRTIVLDSLKQHAALRICHRRQRIHKFAVRETLHVALELYRERLFAARYLFQFFKSHLLPPSRLCNLNERRPSPA